MAWRYLTQVSKGPSEGILFQYPLGVLTDASELIVVVSSDAAAKNNWVRAGYLRVMIEVSGLGEVELFDVALQFERRYIPLPQGLTVSFYFRPLDYLPDFDLVVYESDSAPLITSDQALLLLGFL